MLHQGLSRALLARPPLYNPAELQQVSVCLCLCLHVCETRCSSFARGHTHTHTHTASLKMGVWNKIIEFEKRNPLDLKVPNDVAKRVHFTYLQYIMSFRFHPRYERFAPLC